MKAETASGKLSSLFPSNHVPQIKPTKMIIFQTLNPLSLCNEACREEEKFCAFYFAFGKNSPRSNFIFKREVLYQVIVGAPRITKPGVLTWGWRSAVHIHAHTVAGVSCTLRGRQEKVRKAHYNAFNYIAIKLNAAFQADAF